MKIHSGLQETVQEFRIPLQKEAIIYSRLHLSKSLINLNRPIDKNQHSRNHPNTSSNIVNNPKIISISNQVMSMINLPMLGEW